jgi:nucleoside-diphosphate-sugar epimerase
MNLGSDTPVVLADAIALIERLTGKKAKKEYRPLHAADVMATWADIGRARSMFSWEPKVTFEEGVTRLIDWYMENREWTAKVATE